MSTSVLFDVPGPRARARHAVYAIVVVLGILALLGYFGWRLWDADQITPEKWAFLNQPSIVKDLLRGLLGTVSMAVTAIVLAIVFGAVFASGRLSDHLILRLPSIAVIEFFRAVPVLLMMFTLLFSFQSILGTYWSVVVALVLYNGSVLAEVFRAGILAVPKGQSEAAYAVGLRKGQVLRLIQAPQAVSTMLPAIISQCVVALKDTALGYVIGAFEIARRGKLIFTSLEHNNPIAVGLTLLVVFVILNYSISLLARRLEAQMRRRGKKVVHTEAEAAGA
ncbi:MAG: ABC transporter permease subunit [Propionibacteriales bacterium]|nr:ABC transporter permease subunit [Propionibacteriales bacterium]